jgi:uncharacterized membrane protein YphA (DoxX/SURF4 family)
MSESSAATVSAPARSKGLHIALWVVQILLAFAFGMAGTLKTTKSIPDLVTAGLAWAGSVPEPLVRFIGASELAGALGLILPSLTRIMPMLTPLAALGLVIIMALAAPFHISRGEANVIGINFVLGGLAAFVAWGRSRKAPILPRS